MDNRSIGVFDSGLGGLTVVRELKRLLPSEDIVYFGDTGRVPYGTRSKETIEKYARQDCRLLLRQDVKMIIAACGTVSSVAPSVLEELPVPAIGVVAPAAEAALAATRSGRIGVIGTPATIRTDSYRRYIEEKSRETAVFTEACPMFVPLVENGWITPEDPVALPMAARYLEPLRRQSIDTLILGCTHYPLLTPVIRQTLGEEIALIDAGRETARCSAAQLERLGLLNDAGHIGNCRFLVSDRPDDFIRVADMFLGQTVEGDIQQVDVEIEIGKG